MKNLVGVELYKLKKKHCFSIIFIFNCFSILYSLGIWLDWSWVSFHGTFDVIQYIGAIWQLFFLIGLPLIFFMYLGASLLGGEKAEGQILLEITRVASRRRLVTAKVLAIIISILYYFISNILLSIISYSVLVRRTTYVTSEWMILDLDNIRLLISCIFGCVYIVFSSILVMYLSIKSGTVVSTIIGIAIYAVLSLMTRIPGIQIFVPGYFALSSGVNIGIANTVLQFFLCNITFFFVLHLMRKKISNIDL